MSDITITAVTPDKRDQWFLAHIAPFFMDSKVRKEMPYLSDQPDRVWFLAFKDHKVVGIAGLEDKKATKVLPAHVYLSSLYVLPEHRGQGVSSALVQARLDYAGDREVRTVCVPEVQPLYAKFGFVEHFRRGKYAHMRRRIAAAA